MIPPSLGAWMSFLRPQMLALVIGLFGLIDSSEAIATGMTECELRPVTEQCEVWGEPTERGWPGPAGADLRIWVACRDEGSAPGGPGWKTAWRAPSEAGEFYLLPKGWSRRFSRDEDRWIVELPDGERASPIAAQLDESCGDIPTYRIPAPPWPESELFALLQEDKVFLVLAQGDVDPQARLSLERSLRPEGHGPARPPASSGRGCAGCSSSSQGAGFAMWSCVLALFLGRGCRRRWRG